MAGGEERVSDRDGYVLLLAPCCVCGTLFGSNPELVPSYEGQPICSGCIAEVNRRRQASGQPLWPIHPNAYDPAPA